MRPGAPRPLPRRRPDHPGRPDPGRTGAPAAPTADRRPTRQTPAPRLLEPSAGHRNRGPPYRAS